MAGRSQFGGSSSSYSGGSQASKARMVEHFRDQERQIESLIQSNQLMARKVSGHRARAAAAVAEVAALQTLNAELLQRAMDLPRPQSRPVGSTIKGTSRPGSRASNRMLGESSSGGLEKRPLTATHSLRAHIKDLEEQARLRGILPPPAPKIEENAFPSRPPSRMHPRHARNTVVPRERVFRADENQFRQVEDAFWLLHARERMLRADTEAACLRLLENQLEEKKKFTQVQATPAAKTPLGEDENQNSTAPPERDEERPAEADPVPPAADHEAEVEERSVASDVGDEAAPPAAAAQSGEQISATMECTVAEWTEWGECSATCGNGAHTRTRAVTSASQENCPALSETAACADQPDCAAHCGVSQWAEWSPCNQMCESVRMRTITISPGPTGAECPALSQARPCDPEDCATNCEVSQWSMWGLCSATCGTASRSRHREMLQAPQREGAACPEMIENEELGSDQLECAVPACHLEGTISADTLRAAQGKAMNPWTLLFVSVAIVIGFIAVLLALSPNGIQGKDGVPPEDIEASWKKFIKMYNEQASLVAREPLHRLPGLLGRTLPCCRKKDTITPHPAGVETLAGGY
eukprot:g8154.t1